MYIYPGLSGPWKKKNPPSAFVFPTHIHFQHIAQMHNHENGQLVVKKCDTGNLYVDGHIDARVLEGTGIGSRRSLVFTLDDRATVKLLRFFIMFRSYEVKLHSAF